MAKTDTSLKIQLVKNATERAHDFDLRDDKFMGDPIDEHHTISLPGIGSLEIENLDDDMLAFVLTNGSMINKLLGQFQSNGFFLRAALFNGKEQ